MTRDRMHDDAEFGELRKMFVLEAREGLKELRSLLEASVPGVAPCTSAWRHRLQEARGRARATRTLVRLPGG
jgi:hypothetical protein